MDQEPPFEPQPNTRENSDLESMVGRETEPINIDALPQSLGFVLTPELEMQRSEVIEAYISNNEDYILTEAYFYFLGAQRVVEQRQGDDYARAQLGMNIDICLIDREAGRLENYLVDLQDAYAQAWNMHLDEVAAVLQQATDEAEAELAQQPKTAEDTQAETVTTAEISDSESSKVRGVESETAQEPTSELLAAACTDILSEENCAELAAMEFDEALGYSFSLLIENGIEDPESYLRERNILE